MLLGSEECDEKSEPKVAPLISDGRSRPLTPLARSTVHRLSPRALPANFLTMPAPLSSRSRSPIWARGTNASRGQEVPAPGRRRSVSAPRRPTAGAAAQRLALDLGRPRPLPPRVRARSAPPRARPDAAGTLREAKRRHSQEQQQASQEARSREQAQELMRLRRSLKALSVERDELRAFKEGAEKSVKQRERRWILEKSALSARLLEMESGFAEQARVPAAAA